MQPPLTEPVTFIPGPINIPAPVFLGADRHVRITLASTKASPELTQFN